MKKVLLALFSYVIVGCSFQPSFEARIISELCNDKPADTCIITLPGDTTSTHYVKVAFGNNGIYYISDLPLIDPRMRLMINDGLRTRYFANFEYISQQEEVYVYSLAYKDFPHLSKYEFDLLDNCELYYYNGENTFMQWYCTWYPKSEVPFEESFEKWFDKAIPYILE